ncbi:hypothetical protein VTL71DRAFT_16139 [Oculimacula yallundae]|uniref:Ankyrin n=1 Tax=Oculimacula yallundae TaxID=86028 RepID=A0ABR4CFP1_9HELO
MKALRNAADIKREIEDRQKPSCPLNEHTAFGRRRLAEFRRRQRVATKTKINIRRLLSANKSSIFQNNESIHDDVSIEVPISADEDSEQPQVFKLSWEYLQSNDILNVSPSMMAAREPDERYLKAVLYMNKHEKFAEKHVPAAAWADRFQYEENGYPSMVAEHLDSSELGANSLRWKGYPRGVGITSPLMEAIRARLPDNVDLLLKADADPNGIPLKVSELYAAFFLRFRPAVPSPEQTIDVATRDRLLSLMDLPQLSTLTREEVEDRFYEGVAPFWCEEGFVKADYFKNGDSMPSLVEAAKSGSFKIFDRLLATGADCTFWTKPQLEMPNPPTSSSLSVSSPTHAALQMGDLGMLKHLLRLGFDPNTMPLANPTRCFTPAMATIIYGKPFNGVAFDILCQHPDINLELRTPVYRVHILHFAVATLNLDLLRHVSARTPLQNAGETALGHTLLHIACMPANASQVQRHSELVCQSINECRDLCGSNDIYSRLPQLHQSQFQTDIEYEAEERKRQTAMVQYLWEQGVQNLETQDVHGNTALHYLAGHCTINWELLEWWWSQPAVWRIWQEANNRYAASPEEMSWANQLSESEEEKKHRSWRTWLESWWKVGRESRKKTIWMRLLGDDEATRRWFNWSQGGSKLESRPREY